MSLNVYLENGPPEDSAIAADLLEEKGFTDVANYLRNSKAESVYESNITHNLGNMANAAGIYEACWRPEEINITKAKQLVPLLEEGLRKLEADPGGFATHNSPNGWGLYEHFVPWVKKYLEACRQYPEANVKVSR